MKVSDFMTRNVRFADPNQSIREAARQMLETDVGALPVCVDGELVGIITDRDIAVRAVAIGKGPEIRVGEIMSREVKSCRENEDAVNVAERMAHEQIRRVVVLDNRKKILGIVSLADFAIDQEPDIAGVTLRGISQPGGAHCQTSEAFKAA